MRYHCVGLLCAASFAAACATAQEPAAQDTQRRTAMTAFPAKDVSLKVLRAGKALGDSPARAAAGQTCPVETSTHTDANLDGGPINLIVFGGLFEGESVAASYVLDAASFPIVIDSLEVVFSTFNATIPTTTLWSALVFEGTPDTGTLVGEINSDGIFFPHIEMEAGSNALLLHVEPLLPIVIGDNGSQTFSVAWRVDAHNQPPPDPCTTAPNCCNAFPAIDVSGTAAPTGNWVNGLNCGPGSCPPGGGWANYQQLGVLCAPSADWIIRATWTPNICEGACCFDNGSCQEDTVADCNTLGGTFQGIGAPCGPGVCAQATEACCLPSGGCVDIDAVCCSESGGTPQGGTSTCEQGPDCAVLGACCFPTDFCLELEQSECSPAGGSWAGPGTDCTDADDSGIADACELCVQDLNGDGTIDAADLALLLGSWGDCP